MKRIILISLIISSACIILVTACPAQETNLKEADRDSYFNMQMTTARLKFTNEDYYGALRIYRELRRDHPDDALLNFRMGECFVKIKLMDTALVYLEKASHTDTMVSRNLFLILGQALHYKGKVDEAIEAYYSYKNRLDSRKIKLLESEKQYVNELLRQCLTAKELMQKPVKVKITKLGNNINSEYTDANPSVTADGKTLIFTSRRPGTTGGKIDPECEEYFDDIYMSKWDNKTRTWGACIQFGPPLNTEGHDANLSISPDGRQILLYKNITGETQSGDIYISTLDEEELWSKPKPFASKNINSSFFESSSCLSADGNTLFFVSERVRGGFGNGDIYISKKMGEEWSKPENLGSVVNSIGDEIGIYIHPDGKTLFFSSDGHNTMGGYDVFMTVFEDGRWSEPVNMGYPINTTRDEIHFILATDRKKAYLSSSRESESGKTDIFEVDMSQFLEENKQITESVVASISGPILSILKGSVVDDEGKPVQTNIYLEDMATNEKSVITSNEKGEYFATLPADRRYEIKVEAKGFKPMAFKFKLPKGEGETFTLTKHIILNKK
ncbi:MAG: PD40 domain-containing protein [Bacteroidia bacterium]|nr:PD40 domain-containing protein [Bacteroidia bacterium]